MSYLTRAQLRLRGWNDRLVRQFLSGPDDARQSSGSAGRPQHLYRLDRVLHVECLKPQFAESKARKGSFSVRTKKNLEAKALVLKDVVDSISLPPLTQPYSDLLTEVHEAHPGTYGAAAENRLALALLLDRMQSLHAPLNLYTWHSGVREARLHLKQKILAHIIDSYPALQSHVQDELAKLETGGSTG